MTLGRSAARVARRFLRATSPSAWARDYLLDHLPGVKNPKVKIKPGTFMTDEAVREGLDRLVEAWELVRQGLARVDGSWVRLMGETDLTVRVPGTNRHYETGATVLNPWLSDGPEHMADTIAHEIGHMVWYQVLAEDQRSAWVTVWRLVRAGQIPGGRFVTRYASTSPEEDFAEVFMHVVRRMPLDDLNADRWASLWEPD